MIGNIGALALAAGVPFLFAQVPVAAPGSIESWLIAFAAIVVIVNQVMGLVNSFRRSPQIVQMAETFTTRASFHKHAELNRAHHEKIESRIAALEAKREQDKTDIINAGEERACAIHDRINVVIEKVGELRGQMSNLAGGRRA